MPPPTFADQKHDAATRSLTFTLHNTPVYFANALRRVLLAELVVSGVPNAYKRKKPTTKQGKPHRLTGGVIVHTNTGRLHNEMLLHRLSLLPIGLDPRKWQRPAHGETLCMTLRKSCPADANEPVVVTSRDITLTRVKLRSPDADTSPDMLPNDVSNTLSNDDGTTENTTTENASDPPHTSLHTRTTQVAAFVPPSQQGVMLTRLYPDEALDIDLYPDVDCAGNYAGYAPLYTCTYVRDTTHPTTHHAHSFAFTLQGVGTHPCDTLVRTGLDVLSRKLTCVSALLQPRTVELDFGTRFPALHALVQSGSTCWVRWSNHDYLAMQHEHIHESHVQEVIATTTDDDAPVQVDTPFAQDVRVPAVDGEDIPDTPDTVKHVLAMHQPHFGDNGVYEYHTSTRKYTRSTSSPPPLYIIAKDGRTRCGMVYTPADVVLVHDTRMVLRFSSDIPEHVFDHIKQNIDGCVCDGVLTDTDALAAQMDTLGVSSPKKNKKKPTVTSLSPPVHVFAPHVAREALQMSHDDTRTLHELHVDNEDHTLGNLVQGYVYDWFLRTNKALSPADKKDAQGLVAMGYKQPLPSKRRISFRAEFEHPLDHAAFVACFTRWLARAHEVVESVKDKW